MKKLLIFLSRIAGIALALYCCYLVGDNLVPEPGKNAAIPVIIFFKTVLGFFVTLASCGILFVIFQGLQKLWPEDSYEEKKEKLKKQKETEKLSDPNFDPLAEKRKLLEISNKTEEVADLVIGGKHYKIRS